MSRTRLPQPEPLPPLKSLGVMCCGCYRMMAPNGKPLTMMRQGSHGIPEPIETVTPDDIAWFGSPAECDEAARKAGWRAEDKNHRCPDCVRLETVEDQPGRRGAYVRFEDLFPITRTTHRNPQPTSIQHKKES